MNGMPISDSEGLEKPLGMAQNPEPNRSGSRGSQRSRRHSGRLGRSDEPNRERQGAASSGEPPKDSSCSYKRGSATSGRWKPLGKKIAKKKELQLSDILQDESRQEELMANLLRAIRSEDWELEREQNGAQDPLEVLRRATDRLSLDDRQLMALRYVGQLSETEIAWELHQTEVAVRESLKRIRQRLRGDLERAGVLGALLERHLNHEMLSEALSAAITPPEGMFERIMKVIQESEPSQGRTMEASEGQ